MEKEKELVDDRVVEKEKSNKSKVRNRRSTTDTEHRGFLMMS